MSNLVRTAFFRTPEPGLHHWPRGWQLRPRVGTADMNPVDDDAGWPCPPDSDWPGSGRVARAIESALIKLVPTSRLLDWLAGEDPPYSRTLLAEVFRRRKQGDVDVGDLTALAAAALRTYRTAPSTAKQRIETNLKHLVSALDPESRFLYANELAKGGRQRARSIGLKMLMEIVGPESTVAIQESYDAKNDTFALGCLVRRGVLPAGPVETLMDRLAGDPTGRARVLEILYSVDPEGAWELAQRYPLAFVQAAGRCRWPNTVSIIQSIAEGRAFDSDGLSLCAWALGRLGAVDALAALARGYDVDRRLL